MSLFKLVEAHRGRSRLTAGDEDKLKEIRAFFEKCRIPGRSGSSGRCFTIPWLRDWFEPGQSGCNWWQPQGGQQRKFMKYVAFLNKVGIPTMLCEPQPSGSPQEPVRPFLYVQMHINLGELPDSYYLTERAAKEKKLIPEKIKCEFIEPILKYFVLSCYQMIEGMGKSNLVAILDSSGWHAESAKHKLSFRLVMPELAVTLQTTRKIREKVVFRLRGALRSTKWLNFEEFGGVEAIIPKDAFSTDMTHPLAFCCWSGKYRQDRRWLRPFALMHTLVEGETCAVDSLNRCAEKLKPEDWMRLASPWSESRHCRPERRHVVEDC